MKRLPQNIFLIHVTVGIFCSAIGVLSTYIFGTLLYHSILGENPPAWMENYFSLDAYTVYFGYFVCSIGLLTLFL